MTFAHLCDSVPVVDNPLSMGADVYVRAARARALKAEELDFEGRFRWPGNHNQVPIHRYLNIVTESGLGYYPGILY